MKKVHDTPVLSVIMPVYNAADFLRPAIESILHQSLSNFEFIIIDDASTDKSFSILKKFADQDTRIRLHRNKKNIGIGAVMNKGLRLAKTPVIARMDADDIALPERLETQYDYLKKHKKIAIVGSYMIEINGENVMKGNRKVPTASADIYRELLNRQTIQNPSMMMVTSRIPEHELYFDPHFSPVDDLDFYFRTLQHVKAANIPDYLMYYRKHTTNSSLQNIKKTFGLTWQVRTKALKLYGHKPSLIPLMVSYFQYLVVMVLPDSLTYTAFKLWKGIHLPQKYSLFPKIRLARAVQ